MSRYSEAVRLARTNKREPEQPPPPDYGPEWPPDWDPWASGGPQTPPLRKVKLYLMDVNCETPYGRKLRMLNQLSLTCYSCTMCELGRKYVERPGDAVARDPHCFSNMNPTRVMVVGQNPGWDELKQGTPFVGQSGDNFNAELLAGGLTRDDVYISNVNRCLSPANAKPTTQQRKACTPFLHMEVTLIRPKLVATLGAVALDVFCPGARISESSCKILKSEEFGVNVFPLYHPSPLNLDEGGMRGEFTKQMRLFCKLVNRLKVEEPAAFDREV